MPQILFSYITKTANIYLHDNIIDLPITDL